MADEPQQSQAEAAEATTTEPSSDLLPFLHKRVKAKTDEAKQRVDAAVETMAEHVLKDQALVSDDVLKTIRSIIAGLDEKMTEQVKRFNLPIENNEVVSVDFSEPVKKITLNDRTITTHTIIIATGASPKKLGVPGEDTFYGKGISSCATCDGPFFKDRIVAAVGGGDTAVQESLFLTKFAKKVYLIHRRDKLRAAAILQKRALANEKIETIWE